MLGILASSIAIIGIAPYIALQLKAITSTFNAVTNLDSSTDWLGSHVGLVFVVMMILFTTVFGIRKLDPTERHQGMIMAIALGSIIKLAAFLAAGIFIVYIANDGILDIFSRALAQGLPAIAPTTSSGYITWMTYLVLSASAILFLPRQFHVGIIENFHEDHIKKAMWMFPLYFLIINILVLPIALAGLLNGFSASEADTFLISLPMAHNNQLLALFVFIGGFSAGASMIMISAISLSTMLTNHILFPLTKDRSISRFIRRNVLPCRWMAATFVIFLGYLFERLIGDSYMLVNMGTISFAAVLQFAPVVLAGIFSTRSNKSGAIMGLLGGFSIWIYTLMFPAIIRSGWFNSSLLEHGPWGMAFLKPESLLGLTALPPLSHSVFWSMIINVGLLLIGSSIFRQSQSESTQASRFVGILQKNEQPKSVETLANSSTHVEPKLNILRNLLGQYFDQGQADKMVDQLCSSANISTTGFADLSDLSRLITEAETVLAGVVGSATAHTAVTDSKFFTPEENNILSQHIGDLISAMNISPQELHTMVDYYKEKEQHLKKYSEELESRVSERTGELRESNAKLRESMEFHEKLVNSSVTAIFTVDAKRRITNVNDLFCEILGYTRDEVLNQECHILQGNTCSQSCGLFDEPVATTHRKKQCQIQTKSGQKLTILKNADYLQDASGNVIGGVESFVDITALNEAREAAENANRTKSEFLANMSHEIRTPMNGVMGMIELTLDSTLSDEQRHFLTLAKQSADSLLNIINDILDFSKIEAKKMELDPIDFDLEDCIANALSVLGLKADQKGIELIARLEMDSRRHIIGDPGRIRQVIVNLVGNAIKFTSKGSVVVSVIEKKLDEQNVSVYFEILDTGIGISKERQPKIFESFEQADGSTTRQFGGTGLGLSIAGQLVELMGGKIEIESELGKGSRFWFALSFPLGSKKLELPDSPDYSILEKVPILVVDDNQINRTILQEMLSRWKMIPDLAESAEEALNLLAKAVNSESMYPLLLLDVCMPSIDGFELVRRIRADDRFTSSIIMMLSSAGRRGDARLCKDLGITAYLTKPIRQSVLLQAFVQALKAKTEDIQPELITKHSIREAGLVDTQLEILLAEDNKVNQLLAVRILQRAGYKVTVAENGREAVEKFQSYTFDFILMDIQMPVMGGYEATKHIRDIESKTDGHIPIIAMTAHAMAGDKAKCINAGMDNYVSKPIDTKQLLEVLNEHAPK